LYARVSTLNHGQEPEAQLRELRAYCERRGFEIVEEYVDKGISGSRERRPSLDRMMTPCRKRLVDAVVKSEKPSLGNDLGLASLFLFPLMRRFSVETAKSRREIPSKALQPESLSMHARKRG